MTKRVRASGKVRLNARFDITEGFDTDKNFIVAAVFHAENGAIEAKEFKEHREDALRCDQWFKDQRVEYVIIESTANFHLLHYDTLRQQGINIAVINPILVKSLLRVEGKSDKGDAMTLARLAASFALKTSNMPDAQQSELRLSFRQIDAWKVQRTQLMNRINSILISCGLSVFRLTAINGALGLRILQAVVDGRSTTEIAALHRMKSRRAEVEKCVSVEIPGQVRSYLRIGLVDVHEYIRRILATEADLLSRIERLNLTNQVTLMCSVPGVTKMLALCIISELGDNSFQLQTTAEAFTKAIGVVLANEVSGGKLLKRKSSHGNRHVKYHLLLAAKAFALHGKGYLFEWFKSYRERSNYMKATSALARRMAEALWWAMVRQQPYRHWEGRAPVSGAEVIETNAGMVDPNTGGLLAKRTTETVNAAVYDIPGY